MSFITYRLHCEIPDAIVRQIPNCGHIQPDSSHVAFVCISASTYAFPPHTLHLYENYIVSRQVLPHTPSLTTPSIYMKIISFPVSRFLTTPLVVALTDPQMC